MPQPHMKTELYRVKLDYPKPDGLWVHSHVEEVPVELPPGAPEKCNHSLAEQAAKKKFPGCRIVTVTYC